MTGKEHDEPIDDIGCLQAIEQLYAYLDGELTADEKDKFEHHMGHCRSCYSRRELEIELSKRLQKATNGAVPDSLQNRLRDLIDKF